MARVAHTTREMTGVAPDAIPFEALIEAQQPVILRGVARDWPLVRKAAKGAAEAIACLKTFDAGRPVIGYTGAPEIGGRFFYNEDTTGLNFEAARVALSAFLDLIAAHLGDRDPPSFYIGSTDVDMYLPGLRVENDFAFDHEMFAPNPPIVSIWIGNRTIASAHYDMSNNIACCVAGRRRFTLFPPEQIENLYPGPLEPTPGGQVVNMADIQAPDHERFPKRAEALAAEQLAGMEPGDALFYPAMWWHQVDALESFNVMINFWWN